MGEGGEGATRRLLSRFLHELPWLLGIWVVATLAFVVFGLVSGDMEPKQAIIVAVGLLPLAIPLAPLTWMRWEPATRTPRALPGIGFGCLWAVVTMPLAIGLSLLLTRLLGGTVG